MKKPLVALALALTAGAGYYAYTAAQHASGDSSLTLYGNVDIREVQMGFRVGGRLQDMYFEEGDAVAAGGVLASLDDQPQREVLAMAEARVAEAQARFSMLERGARPQEIKQARAGVEEAEAGLDNAEHEYLRQKDLVVQEMSSQRELDQSLSSRDQWAARLVQSRQALDLAVEGFRMEEIAQARAVLAAAQAHYQQASTQLADTHLLAPSPGIIMTRVVEPGSMVEAGMPVYTLSLTENIYVRAYVDEPNLGHVKPGSRVVVTSDTGGRQYEGQVGFIW